MKKNQLSAEDIAWCKDPARYTPMTDPVWVRNGVMTEEERQALILERATGTQGSKIS